MQEVRLAADFVLNREVSRVVFYPPLYGLCLKEHRKGNGRTWNQMGRKNLPGLRLC